MAGDGALVADRTEHEVGGIGPAEAERARQAAAVGDLPGGVADHGGHVMSGVQGLGEDGAADAARRSEDGE